jgi:TetR/AcrR family transcriptional repressor of nem operon
MPWNKDHKSATRERILESASTAIRERGVAGVGVKEVMDKAGLTHGGFYAHFASKDELLADAFAFACTQSGGILDQAAEKAAPGEKLTAVAQAYLSASHARHPERGCPIAAVGPELVRGEGPARQTLGETVRKRLAWLENLATGKSKEERRRKAAATYATMLGALFVARALGDEEGEKYLAQVRRSLSN